VRVAFGHLDISVTENLFEIVNTPAVHHEVSSESVAKIVDADLSNARMLDDWIKAPALKVGMEN
jgi:hypothetical protein